MEKIDSFTIDHHRLLRGIYVSRQDKVGDEVITTFDIRLKAPNREPVIDVPALHTLEHLGATFLRNHPSWGDRLIYFGPMGCRTGMYAVYAGDLTAKEVVPVLKEMFYYIAEFSGDIPGASAEECGNYLSQDLPMAKWEAGKFLSEILNNLKEENLHYPD